MLGHRIANTSAEFALVQQRTWLDCAVVAGMPSRRKGLRRLQTTAMLKCQCSGSFATEAERSRLTSPRLQLVSRRALIDSLVSAAVLLAGSSAAATQAEVLTVGQGKQFGNITDAIAAATSGAVIRIEPGRYPERLTIDKAITLVGDSDNPSSVEVVWETSEPYQPTIFCTANNIVVRGLTIRHKSPSIANNYAVQMQDCNAAMDSCDISSATGSGVGSEGGSPQVYSCSIHDCASNGIAIFGGLDGSRASAVVENCDVQRNKGHGILVRDGATPAITDSFIFRNGGYGMMLQDCGGSYSRNVVKENFEGAVGHLLLFEDFDVNEIVVENKLDRYPQKLTPLRR